MKAILYCSTLLALISTAVRAQEQPYQISEVSQNYRIWQKTEDQILPNGQKRKRVISEYTQLENGLYYWKDGSWQETQEKIEIANGMGVAQKGPIQVIFNPDFTAQGAVDVLLPGGERLRTTVYGLVLYDESTGVTEMLAEPKATRGEVRGDNEVWYPLAFDSVKASVRYVYRKGSFSQEVILEDNVLDPQVLQILGMNPATTKIELWTEVFNPPTPQKRENLIQAGDGVNRMVDEQIDFGTIHFDSGKAFSVGQAKSGDIPVSKRWVTLPPGRHFLIEGVTYAAAAPHLATLPRGAAIPKKKDEQMAKAEPNRRSIPGKRVAQVNTKPAGMQMAMAKPQSYKGFTIDYEAVVTAADVLFDATKTYLVSSDVTLSGTTTFEGGTLITYATSGNPRINVTGKIVCYTDAYRPVVMTGSASGPYASTALRIDNGASGTNAHLSHFRICYANTGLEISGESSNEFSHFQFVSCGTGVKSAGADSSFRNALFFKNTNAFNGTGGLLNTGRLEHITFDQVENQIKTNGITLFVTNSLLVAVTNIGTFTGLSNGTNSTPTNAFQTVASGQHYLISGSTNRNAGTTNINSALRREFKKRTTYPPTSVSTSITTDTTWQPQVQRDTDVPDLGWHYAAADYLIAEAYASITNATLYLTNGVVVVADGNHALWINDLGSAVSEGSPTSPNHLCHLACIQETNNWTAGNGTLIYPYHYASSPGTLSARFTTFDTMAGYGHAVYTELAPWALSSIKLRDCELFGGSFHLAPTTGQEVILTNNLLFRCDLSIFSSDSGQPLSAINNLFYRTHWASGGNTAWVFKNNAFDGIELFDLGSPIVASNNAYINTTVSWWPFTNASDVFIGGLTYDSGYLGRFYQATGSSLVNKGFTTADAVNMYHYTIVTNQVKETNTVVDIGYHYVAATVVSGEVQALDYDGDGVPDYLEDRNGNGTADGSENDWQTYNSLLGINNRTGLKVFTPLR